MRMMKDLFSKMWWWENGAGKDRVVLHNMINHYRI